jgi:ComEC/Rec2-related protein
MNKKLILGLMLIIGVVGWRVWGWWSWQEELRVGEDVEFSQRLWQEPEKKWYGYRWKYHGQWVMCEEKNKDCDLLRQFTLGDNLVVEGSIGELKVQGEVVGKKIQVEQLTMENSQQIWVSLLSKWMTALGQLRSKIVHLYQQYLDEPYAGLVAGVVVGEQGELSQEFEEDLINTGTLHVVAASGYNITVVAGVLMAGLVLILHRRRAVWWAMIGIWSYVMLAGMSPAVVRAGLMGSLVFGAQALGKEYIAKWGLFITAVLMLLISPHLAQDVSFQLSVMAAAGILWGYEPIKAGVMGVLDRVPIVLGMNNGKDTFDTKSDQAKNSKVHASGRAGKSQNYNLKVKTSNTGADEVGLSMPQQLGALGADLSTTLAATLATLPITIVVFGRVSLVSPVVNMLVLWLVPPMMGLGALTALLGLLVEPLGQLAAYLVYPLAFVFVRVVEVFGSIPGASVEVSQANWWLGVGWWLICFGWWGGRKR